MAKGIKSDKHVSNEVRNFVLFFYYSNGVELAKALSSEGAHVYGWDMEWNMDYNINRYSTIIWSGILTIILTAIVL